MPKKPAIFKELEALMTPPPEKAFTRKDVEAQGVSYSTAKRMVEEKVNKGELKSGKFMVDGHITTYYWEA